jgi:hypothetical protein
MACSSALGPVLTPVATGNRLVMTELAIFKAEALTVLDLLELVDGCETF